MDGVGCRSMFGQFKVIGLGRECENYFDLFEEFL